MHTLSRLIRHSHSHRRRFFQAAFYSAANKLFDILPEVLIGLAVDVVVKGERSFLAQRVLGYFGWTDTWSQLLALGA
ncbi:MAG TPA: hypothetical protein VLC09_15505, partial [Polyangiaceae bacterium]|nr:hypothetical protein [Polyangiaceae bacterium]